MDSRSVRRLARGAAFALFVTSVTFASASAWAKNVKETIIIVREDLASTVIYDTTRSRFSSYTLNFPKGSTLEPYLYIFPNSYTFDQQKNADFDLLEFRSGEYGLISSGSLAVEGPDPAGIFTVKSWDGKKLPNGHFGFWSTPDDFTQFAIAWVLPDSVEIVDHTSNRPGEWVTRGNTLAFFAKDTNDVTFEWRYRLKSQELFQSLRGAQTADVEVEQRAGGVRLVLADRVLFASGESELSPAGREVLASILPDIRARDDVRVVIAGHTDDVAIQGALAERFPTNWELSSARALSVLRALAEGGITGDRLEARAYGEHRPRASNGTAEGRAKNRRIEISVELVDTGSRP